MGDPFAGLNAGDLERIRESLPVVYGVLTKEGVMYFGPEDGLLYEAAKLGYERNVKRMLCLQD